MTVATGTQILKMHVRLSDVAVSLSTSFFFLSSYGPAFRQIKSISGATKRAGEPRWWKSIDIQDVPDVVQVSFNCGTFQACGARWHALEIRFHQLELTSSTMYMTIRVHVC